MSHTRLLMPAGLMVALCALAAPAAAQTGAVSDFSGAGVSSSAFLGPFAAPTPNRSPNLTFMNAALGDMAFKLGVSLGAGTVTGGGFTTSGRGVQALGRLMLGSTAPTADTREAVARAFRASGAPQAQVDRLVSALAGLLMNSAASLQGTSNDLGGRRIASGAPGGPDASDAMANDAASRSPSPFASRRLQNLSATAVDEAAAAFEALVNSASERFLRDPPEEFQAVYSALYELRCAENTAAGATAAMCAPPEFVIDQPPPRPLVNQDSIDAAERTRAAAAALRLHDDSVAAAAVRAHEDSVNAATRAVETARARTVLETRVFFGQNQFTLSAGDQAALDEKLRVLKANPDVRLRVAGNVDERETGAYNRLLGRFRAEQARSYLVARGIDVDRIDIVDNGARRPVCTQHRESCWSRNRRDEFLIIAGGDRMRMP